MNEIDDFELLHNVQIWIDENQNRLNPHDNSILKNYDIDPNKNSKQYQHHKLFSDQNPRDANIFINSQYGLEEQNQKIKSIDDRNIYKNNFMMRKGSTNMNPHNKSDMKELISQFNLPQKSPQHSYRYKNNNQQFSIHKHQEIITGQCQKLMLNINDNQQFNERQNEVDQNLFYPNNNIISKPTNEIKAKSQSKPRGLKPLPKQFYMLKRYDAQHIFQQLSDNCIYNFDYNINDLQLKGSQFQSKPSPLPQNSKKQQIAQILENNSNKHSLNNHKELLHFLKQKYQEQQMFISQNEYQMEPQRVESKQKHFDIQNFDQYSKPYTGKFGSRKVQTLDTSLVSETNQIDLQNESNVPKYVPPKTQEIHKHRKLISQNNQNLKANKSTPLKKTEKSRISASHQKSLQNDQQNDEKIALDGQDGLQQIDESNKAKKTTGMIQRLKPKKNQHNNSTHLLLQQKNLSDHETNEKFLKMQKQIKAKYNDISITQRQQVKEEPYKYIAIRGNNSELVKRCLDERNGDWQEVSANTTIFNFRWVPFSKGIRFDYLSTHGFKKMVNHFEFQDQISQKDTLYYNLTKFCENQKLNVFDFHPITFVINLNQQGQYQELEKFYTYYNILDKNRNIKEVGVINQQVLSHSMFNSVKHNNPNKYTLTQSMFCGKNFWLIKPPDFNRGRGVQVFNTIDQLRKLINDYQQGLEINFSNNSNNQKQNTQSNNNQSQDIKTIANQIPQEQLLKNFTNLENVPNIVKTNEFVIQKYLERPLLIQNRKFDIRLWVLVSHDMKCYLFKEGYIRTSSQAFDLSDESLEKPFIHLTNNAVQRFNDSYGTYEDGNQLSFKKAQEILKRERIDCDFHKIIQEQITQIITYSLRSVEAKINQNNRKFCIEIFGYDFILDENLKPWLIEVNTNPCLEESSGILKQLIPRMIDDALKLTLDVIFPSKKKSKMNIPLESPKESKQILDDSCMNIVLGSEPGVGSAGPTQVHHKEDAKTVQVKEEIQSPMISKQYTLKQNVTVNEETHISANNSNLNNSKYKVEGYSETENMWQLIYQMKSL